jgi:MraZ protein
LFLGKYPCSLDAENRATVPSAYRDQLANGSYLTQGFDRNLVILTADAFHEIHRRIKSLNMADPLARLLGRMLLGSAHELQTEGDGRIRIPDDLAAFAGLDEKALLVGQGDYLEIWSPESWSAQEVQLKDAETNAARFSLLTISTR